MGLLLKRVKKFSADVEHEAKLAGIVISRVGRPALHREATVFSLRQQFGDGVIKSQMSERVAVSEAAARQIPIYAHHDAIAANEFRDVSEEILDRLG